MKIPLDGKAEWASGFPEFCEADVAKFGTAQTKITEAEQSIRIVGIDFGEEPRCARIRREQLDDGGMVAFVSKRIRKQPYAIFLREQFHLCHQRTAFRL